MHNECVKWEIGLIISVKVYTVLNLSRFLQCHLIFFKYSELQFTIKIAEILSSESKNNLFSILQ